MKSMFRNSSSARRFSALILPLVAFGVLTFAPPASATTYQYVVPVSTVLAAMDSALTQLGDNTNLYAFYDFYFRPAVSTDIFLDNGSPTDLTPNGNYTLVNDTSPIPSGVDKVDGTLNVVAPNDNGHGNWLSIHFTFDAANTKVPVILPAADTAINGKTVETGKTAEIMPSTDAFTLMISSTSANITGPITFQIYGVAYQFSDTTYNTLQSKTQSFVGDFTMQGALPEPSTYLIVGSGLCFLLLTRFRRRSA